jgi:hypothetical protein
MLSDILTFPIVAQASEGFLKERASPLWASFEAARILEYCARL